ncbi:MAG: PAS domain S-box protein, partial [Verrucomicrobia bacterium]|nr:PAS domain S-box protein [Verrucomicrobiota bacterium]
MPSFRNLPIRRKLALAMMLTSGVALVVTAALMAGFGISQTHGRMVERANVLADIMAKHCANPLMTANASRAEAELDSFKSSSHILAAWLYRVDGALLARYVCGPADTKTPPPKPEADGHRLEGRLLTVFRPVLLDNGQRAGAICLQYDARDLYTGAIRHAGIAASVLAAALLVAWWVSRRLRRVIADPILELAALAKTVTERKDYSLRAAEHNGDEVGHLVRGFNQMLATIQEHEKTLQSAHDSRARRGEELQRELARRIEAEKKLRTAYDDVEQQVRERTAELQQANEALRREMAGRQRATEALSTAERRFQSLIEHGADVVVLLNSEGVVLYISPSAERVMGYVPREVVGRSAFEWAHPEDLAGVRERFAESLQAPGRLVATECRIHHKDGSWRWIESSANNLLAEPAVGAVVVNFRDITGRKRAGEMLRESEDRLRQALEAGENGTWGLDIKTGKAWRSLRHDQIFGYTELLPEWTYRMFLDHVLAEDREKVDEKYGAALKAHTEWSFECRIRRADGAVRWIGARGRPTLDGHGEVESMTGLVRDITERKQVEEALRESEERYRSLFTTSLDAVLLGTMDGRIVAANATACEMFGFSEQELISGGRNRIADLSDPRWQSATEERTRTGRFYGELTFVRSDGSKLLGEVASAVFSVQGGESRISVVIRDITQRKQVEEALRESEERYRILADNTDDIVALNDTGGTRLYVSPSFYRKTGWTPEEVMNTDWRVRVHPEDLPRVESARAANLAGESTMIEYRMRCRDGSWIWLEANCKPIRVPDGKVWRLLVWSHDITQRKLAEDARRESHALLQTVIEGTADPIFVKDLQGRYVLVNSVAARIIGAPMAEIIGKDDTRFFAPEVAAVFMANDRAIMTSGKTQTYEENVP